MEAYHWLRHRIMSAEIEPGSRLTERMVAEQLGCSTVPVREALLLLAGHHLVSAHNGTGYEVARVAVPAADSTLRLQAHLDSEAAAETARRKDPLTREHLELVLGAGPKAGHTWNDEPGCNDHFDFHVHIAAHAQHESLAKAVNDCLIETERIRRHLLRQGADVTHDYAAHAAIVEALGQGAAKARKAAREHAESHREQLMTALQQLEVGPPTSLYRDKLAY
jgi:DNA-binding GntR family transcriptional regulator